MEADPDVSQIKSCIQTIHKKHQERSQGELPSVKRIFLTCERITAAEEEQMGLRCRTVPKEDLEKKTEQIADRILRLSIESLKYPERQINECMKCEWTRAGELNKRIRNDLLVGFITKEAPERLKWLGKK